MKTGMEESTRRATRAKLLEAERDSGNARTLDLRQRILRARDGETFRTDTASAKAILLTLPMLIADRRRIFPCAQFLETGPLGPRFEDMQTLSGMSLMGGDRHVDATCKGLGAGVQEITFRVRGALLE